MLSLAAVALPAAAQESRSVSVKEGTVSVAVDPVNNRIYAISRTSNTLTEIDGYRREVTRTLTVGESPNGVAVNPGTRRIYVANTASNTVSVIHADTFEVVTQIEVKESPVNLAVNTASNKIYVANQKSNDVAVINGETNELSATRIPLAAGAEGGVAVNPDSNRIYVSHAAPDPASDQVGGAISVIDGSNDTLVGAVKVREKPYQLAVHPLTNTIYISSGSGVIQAINGADNSVTEVIALPDDPPMGVAVSLMNNRLYVSRPASGSLAIIDPTSKTIEKSLAVGPLPMGVAANSVTGRVFVASFGTTPEDATVAIVGNDFVSPTVKDKLSAPANEAGWHKQDVTAALSASDEDGGSGVREIVASVAGAERRGDGAAVSLPITGEGMTTITYYAIDMEGNLSETNTLTVKLDKTPPVVAAESAPTDWMADNVSIAFTASDALSGLKDAADARFVLSTTVPNEEETAAARIVPRTVSDLAGNPIVASPIEGLRVDRKAPVITTDLQDFQPEGPRPIYVLGEKVTLRYDGRDAGSGLATLTAPFPSGDFVDTASLGSKSFVIAAKDKVGNARALPVAYDVGYRVNSREDKTVWGRETALIAMQLADATDKNLSAPGIPVTAVRLEPATPGADLGSLGFAYIGGNRPYYQFSLSTRGLQRGATYKLTFRVGGDPTEHTLSFTAK